MANEEPQELSIPKPRDKDERENVAIIEFKESGKRKRWLFWGVVGFLVVNALVFFGILFWAFYLVAYGCADWHLLGFVALPGILFATVAIMALRAVYNIGGKQGAHEISSMLQTMQNVSGDFSS